MPLERSSGSRSLAVAAQRWRYAVELKKKSPGDLLKKEVNMK